MIALGLVFSLLMGDEPTSLVTISGISLMDLAGEDSFVFEEYRGGLCATSRVLFGRIVRIVRASELTGSI